MNKKKLRWIIFSLAAVFTITITTLSLLVLDFTPSPDPDEDKTNEELLNIALVNTFFDKRDTKTFDFKLDQSILNQMLYNLEDKYNKMHVEINDDNYRFFISSQFVLIPTRIVIDTTLEAIEEDFVFHINSITTGRLNTYGLLNSTGKLKNAHLQEAFSETGLMLQVDYDNALIKYSKKDLEEDLHKMFVSNDSELLLGALESSPKTYQIDNGFKVSLDFSQIEDNPTKNDTQSDGYHYINYPGLADAINRKAYEIFELLEKDASYESVYTYAENTFNELRGYYGEFTKINDLVKERIMEKPTSEYSGTGYDKEVASVSEFDINNILQTSNIIGKSAIFFYDHCLIYVVIDTFYCDVFIDENDDIFINYTIGININGFESRVIIETKCLDPLEEFALDFKVTNIYYGQVNASSAFKAYIRDLFRSAFVSLDDGSWITYQKTNSLVTINFMDLIKNDSELGVYKDIFYDTEGTRQIRTISDGLNEIGKLSLRFIRS